MKNNLTAKQQQLVNEILNRKQLGLESLVEATLKSDKNDTKEEIIKKQKEILSRKEKENQEKTAKNKKEKEKEQNTSKELDKNTEKSIIKQSYLEDAKRRDEWEKRQTERFRGEQKKKNKIRDNILEQLEKLERKERLEEKRRRQQEHKPIKETPKKYKIKNIIIKRRKNKKQDITKYNLIRGVKIYIENIRFYGLNYKIMENDFKKGLAFSVNHKKALENVENNNQKNIKIEPRYI